MNYIITNNRDVFEKIGDYNYCNLEDMVLPTNIAVDTETTGLNPRKGHMFSVQIGTGENNYIIDLQKLGNELKFEQVIPYLKGKNMVFHNSTFDLGWFYQFNFFPKKVYDTFIASKILYNGFPPTYRHGFKHCMKRELGIEYDKTEQKNIHKVQLSTQNSIQYSFNDVDKLLELMKALVAKLRSRGQLETFSLHCRYVRVLAYMEQCGLPIDEDMWVNKIEGDKKALIESSLRVEEYIYDNLPEFRENQLELWNTDKHIKPSLSSTQQMIPVFKALGINVQSDKDPTKASLQEDVIKKSGHEFVDIWLDYKEAAHDCSTYGMNVLDKVEDGRIFTTFNPILDTARISTRKGGVNILNFPANRRTRECIRAKEGNKMVVADYSNQEGVVAADLSQDKEMVKSIQVGSDLHCALARKIFPELETLSDDEIKLKHSDKRQFGKPVRFGASYGASGFSISNSLNVSLKEGEELLNKFKELHTGLYEKGECVLQEAIDKGYIESAAGFRLYLPFYDEFIELEEEIEGNDDVFWQMYRKGKKEYKALKEDEVYIVQEQKALDIYTSNRKDISKYFSLKGRYFRLALNNPTQTTAAHQTKLAACLLFENHIEKNNHYWDVRICNLCHDEVVLESKENLVEYYKKAVESSMKEGGNYFLNSGLVQMEADANSGISWYEAK